MREEEESPKKEEKGGQRVKQNRRKWCHEGQEFQEVQGQQCQSSERSSKTNNDQGPLDLVIRRAWVTFAMMTSVLLLGQWKPGLGPAGLESAKEVQKCRQKEHTISFFFFGMNFCTFFSLSPLPPTPTPFLSFFSLILELVYGRRKGEDARGKTLAQGHTEWSESLVWLK